MKKILFLITILVLIGAVIFYISHKNNLTTNSDKPKVAATIFPIYDISRTIAGDSVDVVLVLPPGASPHSYEPSPEGIKNLQGSDALFMIGHGIDNWSTSMANSAGIEHQITVDKNVQLKEMIEEHHHDEEEDHEHEEPLDGMDPHYWLSMENAEGIATQVRDELSTLYPEYAEDFNKNHKTYLEKLNEVNVELSAKISALPNKNIATFHNAYGYFSESYGLTVVTTFEEFPGEEPTPEYLREFTATIEEHEVTVIFSEPQFSTRSLEPIAQDLGVTISQLDPIGGVEGRESFIALMNYNVNQIISAVSR